MLHSLVDLERYRLLATDGVVGHAEDFFFDDHEWVIRYLVTRTSAQWYDGRNVLISPISLGPIDRAERTWALSITREQVRTSPDVDTQRPVSRQHETEFFEHYDYFPYWGGPDIWGRGNYPGGLEPALVDDYDLLAAEDMERERAEHEARRRDHKRRDDPHLRSVSEILGYHIHATDGDIGRVSDVLVDELTWAVRHLVVETGHWWKGHEVLVAPAAITGVRWSDSSVSLDMTRESIRQAPRRESIAA